METELQQVRTALASLWGRLIAIEKDLQSVHERLHDAGNSSSATPVQKSVQQESVQQESLLRHSSEVDSGEYDMQG